MNILDFTGLSLIRHAGVYGGKKAFNSTVKGFLNVYV